MQHSANRFSSQIPFYYNKGYSYAINMSRRPSFTSARLVSAGGLSQPSRDTVGPKSSISSFAATPCDRVSSSPQMITSYNNNATVFFHRLKNPIISA